MPLHLKDKYRFFSQQWRDSGNAPYRPFMLLYYLFISGEVENQTIKVSSDKFKNMNTSNYGLGADDVTDRVHTEA